MDFWKAGNLGGWVGIIDYSENHWDVLIFVSSFIFNLCCIRHPDLIIPQMVSHND